MTKSRDRGMALATLSEAAWKYGTELANMQVGFIWPRSAHGLACASSLGELGKLADNLVETRSSWFKNHVNHALCLYIYGGRKNEKRITKYLF